MQKDIHCDTVTVRKFVSASAAPSSGSDLANKAYVDSRAPATSTDNAIARFNGTSGVIQNSSCTISDIGDLFVSRTLNVAESISAKEITLDGGVGITFFNNTETVRYFTSANVTQLTSNTTSVTADAARGEITMFGVLAANTTAGFTINDSVVQNSDAILLSVEASTACFASITAVADGSFSILVKNTDTGAATAAAPRVNFIVIK